MWDGFCDRSRKTSESVSEDTVRTADAEMSQKTPIDVHESDGNHPAHMPRNKEDIHGLWNTSYDHGISSLIREVRSISTGPLYKASRNTGSPASSLPALPQYIFHHHIRRRLQHPIPISVSCRFLPRCNTLKETAVYHNPNPIPFGHVLLPSALSE